MYRIYIWNAETGSIRKKRDYQRLELAKARAIEASLDTNVREVSVCEIDENGEPGPRIGVAAYGEWADGKRAPHVPRHRRAGSNPALATMKKTRRKK